MRSWRVEDARNRWKEKRRPPVFEEQIIEIAHDLSSLMEKVGLEPEDFERALGYDHDVWTAIMMYDKSHSCGWSEAEYAVVSRLDPAEVRRKPEKRRMTFRDEVKLFEKMWDQA